MRYSNALIILAQFFIFVSFRLWTCNGGGRVCETPSEKSWQESRKVSPALQQKFGEKSIFTLDSFLSCCRFKTRPQEEGGSVGERNPEDENQLPLLPLLIINIGRGNHQLLHQMLPKKTSRGKQEKKS